MDLYDQSKSHGYFHNKYRKKNVKKVAKNIPRSVHRKNNSIRGFRKKRDRYSHHKQRRIQKEGIANAGKNGFEDNPEIRMSFTCAQKRHSYDISRGIYS